MGNETTATQETQFVFRRMEDTLRLFGKEVDAAWFWWPLLVLVLTLAAVYVVVMYRRDSQSVGPWWSTFLGGLRCCVYVLLALVFLLPALQTWEKTETRSRVALFADVSGSMEAKDDQPTAAVPVTQMPTRRDKVVKFLADDQVNFLKRLQEKNPVYFYRFGGRLDDKSETFSGGRGWDDGLTAWLAPQPKQAVPANLDKDAEEAFRKRLDLHQALAHGTNYSEALLDGFNREANNMLQAFVVVGDGRSTTYSAQALDELKLRARKAKVPILAVAVGEHRTPVSIQIADFQSPEQARPDEPFKVRVEVDGEGLPNKEITVTLNVTKPKGDKAEPLTLPVRLVPAAGGVPHAQAEFEIDPAKLGVVPAGEKKPELEEGEWVFEATVPGDPREVSPNPEHKQRKTTVAVVKKPLRVLLFADASTKEFQFARTLFVREVDQRRMELSLCLQTQRQGVVLDVPPERLLKQFPYRLEEGPDAKPEDKYYSLSQYDVVIACDPDWTKVPPEHLVLLENWVKNQGGGLVLIAGPVNTFHLAKLANREKVKPLLDLFPVFLQDSRLQGLGVDRTTTEAWRLNFPGATSESEFLKLDDEVKEQMGGWEEFFTGNKAREPNDAAPPVRGFFNFYPVDGVKPSATVVATFSDPRALTRDGKEQPFVVTMPYGGKIVYLGSGEFWRLRMFKEVFHERFWTKLARYAASGSQDRGKRGRISMGREFYVGRFVEVNAQLFGRDLQFLPADRIPTVQVKPPAGVTLPPELLKIEMKPKPSGGEWGGWFQARFRAPAPGEYKLDVTVPDTGEALQSRPYLVKESKPETDNTQPDYGALYQLASPVTDVLPRMSEKAQEELKKALEATSARLLKSVEDRPAAEQQEKPETADRAQPRLFFDLASARHVPDCMVTDSKTQRSRGPVEDLWDKGFDLFGTTRMAYTLLLVVGLLSVEWLTRKLLKLA